MGPRNAVAATLTSVLVFSTILIANQVVYISENQRLEAAMMAGLERAEVHNSQLLAANAIFDLLASTQARLQESPPACGGWTAYSGALSWDLGVSQTKQGVAYRLNLSARYTDAGPPGDNLTLLGPFDGYEKGSVNLVVNLSTRASMGQRYPFYDKNETHFVHLPVVADRMNRLCLSALESVVGLGSSSSSCSDAALDLLASRYEGIGTAEGLRVEVERISGSSGSCLDTTYQVTVLQGSAEGVAGQFSWKIVGLGAPSP